MIGFYERRARRILPALFTVILVSFAVAPIALSPTHFAEFRESVVAATLFFSNILFWQESGYFDAPANFKPLLHTWSLAVEEQFYIFFPLALLAVARYGGRHWRTFVLSVAVISFAQSSWGVIHNPSATYYLPTSRIWELLLGSLLALRLFPPITNGLFREVSSITGLALIGWGVFTFNDATPFPGANAVFPCFGAALIIHAGAANSSFVNRVLSTRALVFVGLISYSLYLWHWPAFVFARSFIPRELTGFETAGIVAFSLVAATLSWRFVEQPFRGGEAILSRKALFTGVGGFAALFVAIGAFGAATNGWRYQSTAVAAAQNTPAYKYYNYRTCFLETLQNVEAWQTQSCFITDGGNANALLWGDSFAAHYVHGLQANRAAWSHDILQYTAEGCAPVFGWNPLVAPNCMEFNAQVEDIIDEFDIETVIMAGQWNSAFARGVTPNNISDTVQRLKNLGLKVIVIGQSPVFRPNVGWLAARGIFENSAPIVFDENTNRRIQQYSSEFVFIDPLPFLCDGGTCQFRTDDNTYFGDAAHLSIFGSKWLVDRFVPVLDGVL